MKNEREMWDLDCNEQKVGSDVQIKQEYDREDEFDGDLDFNRELSGSVEKKYDMGEKIIEI